MNNTEEMFKGMTPNLPLWSYQLQQNSKLAVKTRKDLETHLITRALKDDEFRQKLLANPKTVLEKELSIKLPEDLEIKVLQEMEDTLYIVLPCNPYEGISEEELKALVGMTYEDVAQWILDYQRNTLLDEQTSIQFLAKLLKDKEFKQKFINDPKEIIQFVINDTVPTKIKLQVLCESQKMIYITLPYSSNKYLDLEQELMANLNSIAIACPHPDPEVTDADSLLGSCHTCTN